MEFQRCPLIDKAKEQTKIYLSQLRNRILSPLDLKKFQSETTSRTKRKILCTRQLENFSPSTRQSKKRFKSRHYCQVNARQQLTMTNFDHRLLTTKISPRWSPNCKRKSNWWIAT